MSDPVSETLVKAFNSGPVAIIELSNPPANSYSYEMMRELDEAILAARFDDGIHAIVLRGEGESFFCAGADISMLKSVSPSFKYNFCLHANETLNRLEQTPKITIAAIA
ncbi:MAG: enoyl-CoA hydratase/isomerase family protein, partial [Planctomycetota bacterium]